MAQQVKEIYKSMSSVINSAKLIVLIAIIITAVTSITNGVIAYKISQNKFLILDKDGDVISGNRGVESDYVLIEADNHVRMFYQTFFTYNRSNYKEQVDRGLNLCGPSARTLYETLLQKNWYSGVVNNDLEITSQVIGPVQIQEIRNEVYTFYAQGEQLIKRGNVSERRKLNIKGSIIKTDRLKVINPHGLKIDDIVITSNEAIDGSTEK